MRHFFHGLFKNLVWIYLCILCCFAYATMMTAIPDHVYLKEGQALALDQKLPVQLSVSAEKQTVMADVGDCTYQQLLTQRSSESCENLSLGEHTVTCYLLGLLPMKEVEVSVVKDQSLYASGHVVGIYGATQGVLVLGSSEIKTVDGSYQNPAENIVFAGDYITKVNGQEITEKEELVEMVKKYGADPLVLTLWRGDEEIQVSVHAVLASADISSAGQAAQSTQTGEIDQMGQSESRYMLGLWVKDDMAGIGTVTYYDTDASFGALGHGIGDGKTDELLRLESGKLYRAEIMGIKKGKRGEPGELEGVVHYGQSNCLGQVDSNTDIGIYGTLNEDFYQASCKEDSSYSVAYMQEVTQSSAVILTDASGEMCVYHIVIDSLDYSPTDRNKGIRFHVDDENLLNLTGGIVQGLSGSPIIQNGKIIGAVTHVLVNDPTRGYGIFIENMLE